MLTTCRLAVLAIGLFLTLLLPANARPVRMWSPDELTQKADIIVIATIKSIEDEYSKRMVSSIPKADTWVPIESVFDVQAVLKGHLSNKTVTIRHYRYFDKSAEVIVSDGPGFVEFNPAKKNQYLIYLKQRPGASYEPLSGQEYPYLSFSRLRPYQITSERS